MNEQSVSTTPTGAHSRHEKAMEKRKSIVRRTIAFERPEPGDIDDDNNNENERNIVKNTNRNMYYANSLYRSLCRLCDKKEIRLVPHYLKHHPECEVLIARPSPAMANGIRSQSQPFVMHNRLISGRCCFCEEMKSTSKIGWMNHILTHTGESMYFCTECNTPFKQKSSHAKCGTTHFKTIFELNGSNETIDGFMCKECNYLQIDRDRLVKHLTSQHDYNSNEVDQYCEKVTLVPDFSHIKTNIKYDYIKPDVLFTCTICKHKSHNFDELEQHIRENHNRISDYLCCCGQKLKINGYNHLTVLSHLLNHCENLYRCMSCNIKDMSTYFSENGLLNHISNEHTKDEWKFQHIYRQAGAQTIVSEIRFIKYICNVCDEEFCKFPYAMNHFRANHPNQITDIKTFVSKKEAELGGKTGETRTNFMTSQNEYVLRQSFFCTKCNYESTSKEDLLAHHNEVHQSKWFEIKRGTAMLIHITPNTTEYEKINKKFDRFMAYSCYQCYEVGNRFISGTAKKMHEHWLENHSGHPFRFYIETLVQCNYCDTISTYKGMLKHIKDHHPKSQICFVDVNVYNKCPLCHSSCNPIDLPEHFKNEHFLILEVNTFNPNRLTEEQFQQLQKIDVHKKPMCDHCGEIFDIEEGYHAHHELKHPSDAKRKRNYIDNSLKGLISACCDQFIASTDFFNHLNVHSFEFTCHECNLKMSQLEDAAQHDLIEHNKNKSLQLRYSTLSRTLRKMFLRTKLFYGNGIVLYKHNLLGTKDDDTEVFDCFLRTKNKEYAAKYKALLKTSDKSS